MQARHIFVDSVKAHIRLNESGNARSNSHTVTFEARVVIKLTYSRAECAHAGFVPPIAFIMHASIRAEKPAYFTSTECLSERRERTRSMDLGLFSFPTTAKLLSRLLS